MLLPACALASTAGEHEVCWLRLMQLKAAQLPSFVLALLQLLMLGALTLQRPMQAAHCAEHTRAAVHTVVSKGNCPPRDMAPAVAAAAALAAAAAAAVRASAAAAQPKPA